jgi:hypothetical protein
MVLWNTPECRPSQHHNVDIILGMLVEFHEWNLFGWFEQDFHP